jgi:hypothetical protein
MRVLVACVAATSLVACTINEGPPPQAELGTFPYHPVVYELDLAILAYQLHAQSMVWPIDPFYEEHGSGRGTSRDTLISFIRTWASETGAEQVASGSGVYRGPGSLAGIPDNPTLDPLVYDYSRLHPWSDGISNNDGRWTEYLTPRQITGRIRDVYVSARALGTGEVVVTQLAPGRVDSDVDATDVLCAFEGATGDKGEAGQPGSYSLMGFVLARETNNGSYDVHVTFRGSRSGDALRAVTGAFSDREAKGNPDWVTDLGWDSVSASTGASDVTSVGGVHRGFARSMRYELPTAFGCMATIAQLQGGAAPANIYVTGHSLGGGLAQHFASAVLLGDQYSVDGPLMPDSVRGWPWRQLKLVTFSAPRGGDYTWAHALSKEMLDSDFYDPSPVETVDADARLFLDPSTVTRLHDATRPAAFRVLISTDPITTTKFGGDGTHVGQTVYVNGTSFIDWIGLVDSADHEPERVRQLMTDAMADPRTPPLAWRYEPLETLVPARNAAEMGTPSEMTKLAGGLRRFYADRNQYFDDAAFTRDLDLLFAIERGE